MQQLFFSQIVVTECQKLSMYCENSNPYEKFIIQTVFKDKILFGNILEDFTPTKTCMQP